MGAYFISDATVEEECCQAARVVIGIDAAGECCALTKTGPGAVSLQVLDDMLRVGTPCTMHNIITLDPHCLPQLSVSLFCVLLCSVLVSWVWS